MQEWNIVKVKALEYEFSCFKGWTIPSVPYISGLAALAH
jgi:hypothetical protein